MKYPILVLSLSVCAVMAQSQTTPPPQPKKEIPPDTVVLMVGDKPYTAGEINGLVKTFSPEIQSQAARDPKQVIQSYFLMRSLADRALKEKLEETSPVKEQLELLRYQTLASAVINRYGESIAVSDEDARQKYEAEKNEKYQQARIRAILLKCAGPGTVSTALDMSDPKAPKQEKAPSLPTENEARLKADEIIKKARAGADFAALAKELSDDKQTAANGGLYPPVRQSDRIPEAVKATVFAMKPGEISEPLRQALGLYVIKMEDRGVMPFEDAKTAVVNEIKQERFQKWMENVRKPFEVTIENPEFFGMKGAAPSPAKAAPAK